MKGKSENGGINGSEHLSLNKRNDFQRALLQASSDRPLIRNPAPNVACIRELRTPCSPPLLSREMKEIDMAAGGKGA